MKKITCFFLVLLALVFIFPVLFLVVGSLMGKNELTDLLFPVLQEGAKGYASWKLFPEYPTLKHYVEVLLDSPEFFVMFWNSVKITVGALAGGLLVGMPAAWGFAKFDFPGKNILFTLYIALMMMPYQVTLVPNYLVLNWMKLLDTNWSIWLPGIFSPFSVYLITKYMRRIPVPLIEAAKIDGANEFQVFTKICIPICKGVITTCAILVFMDYWNMVEQPLLFFNDTDKYPLSIFLSKINAQEVGLAFAVATFYMIPSLLIFLYGEDQLVEGIAYQGGVKG